MLDRRIKGYSFLQCELFPVGLQMSGDSLAILMVGQ